MFTDSSTAPGPSISKLKRLTLAVVLVVCVLAASLYSISTKRQMGLMGGMAEEYLELAINLHRTGNFQTSQGASQPFLLRPPGYVEFLNLIFTGGRLKLQNHVFTSQAEVQAEERKMFMLIYVSQCCLLAASSLVLFLHLGRLIQTAGAFFLALAFGINPYMVVYVGLVHYEMLHLFLLLLSTWLLHSAFVRQDGRVKQVLWLSAGACWGCATLVRPVSLILPGILAAAMAWQFRGSLKKQAVHWLLFVLAFAGVIAPWTWRNYQVAHRIIPVNAQAGVAFWGSSSHVLELDDNHYRWTDTWMPEGQKIYAKVTGQPSFTLPGYVNHNLQLEDAFSASFRANLMAKPGVYLTNLGRNFILMTCGFNSVFVKLFQHLQVSDEPLNIRCLATGAPQDFHPAAASDACRMLMHALTLAAYAGLAFGCLRRDPGLTAPLCGFMAVVLAHVISYSDLMYYYSRVPFLFLFAALLIRQAGNLPARLSKAAAVWLPAAFMLCTAWLYRMVFVA
ncbi:MAG: glycosyltransferase family 39 protein [Verrucomicrobia bacterium]|nr:glycosyltransferase family 39 protein [Verrucomicrobiota bacterium]